VGSGADEPVGGGADSGEVTGGDVGAGGAVSGGNVSTGAADVGVGGAVSGIDGTNESDDVDALLPHAADSESTIAANPAVRIMRRARSRRGSWAIT